MSIQDKERTRNENEESRAKQIEQSGSVTVETRQSGKLIHCLTIIGQIEGHYTLSQQNKTTKYEHVIPQLVAIEESQEISGLLIVLNTVGGDVEAGLAIAELIAGMRKPTVSLVLGGGHSIGVPLAVSARRSFIVPSATMTIHPVRMNGLVLGIPQTFSYFERMQDRIVSFVANNSHMPADRMRSLMMETGEMATDVGTVLDGEHAVREGLIDQLGGLRDAIDCLHQMIEEDESSEPDSVPAQPDATCPPDGRGEGPRRKPAAPKGTVGSESSMRCAYASGSPVLRGLGQSTTYSFGGGYDNDDEGIDLPADPPLGKDPRYDGSPADLGGQA